MDQIQTSPETPADDTQKEILAELKKIRYALWAALFDYKLYIEAFNPNIKPEVDRVFMTTQLAEEVGKRVDGIIEKRVRQGITPMTYHRILDELGKAEEDLSEYDYQSPKP